MNETKVMLVTGAARRLGKGIVKYFHQAGYRLVLHYRNSKDDAETIAEQLNSIRPNSVKLTSRDFGKAFDYESWLQECLGDWGRLDVLVNNASSFYPTKLGEITAEKCYDLYASNALAPLLLSQAALPYLKRVNGCIINIIDIHGVQPLREYMAYSMAKAALHMLTLALAKECGPAVRINGVAPGAVIWPEGESTLTQAQQKQLLSKVPLAKQGNIADIVATIEYLTKAEFVTGEVIAVDGGRALR